MADKLKEEAREAAWGSLRTPGSRRVGFAMFDAGYDHATAEMAERVERLEKELEIERMRLAACGVLAMSNTRESLAKNRQMHPDYYCASVSDVITTVEREIVLRERIEAIEATEGKDE